jgi:lysozyme family protein
MRDSYPAAFKLTIGLEGKPSNDPDDPGGFTIWGLAKRYHPEIDANTAIEQAEAIYLKEYWIPSGCDDQPFPMDVCLFDSAVNPQNDPKLPGAGNQEILNMNPRNWQEYMIFRMQRYMRVSKDIYVKGHIFRVLRLCDQIKSLGG